ncbi:MAG: protein-glutamate O-methyltransferase CheR [Deltaproteobacteria bacterium]|nr:protein-glutamate O-methyltransferase CheR [Deltaproteobacteria bacterium]
MSERLFTESDFADFRDLILERTGISIRETRIDYLEFRVLERVRSVNAGTVRDYYYRLKYGPHDDPEFQALVNAITVQETYFYRNPRQLETLKNNLLPEVLERKKQEADQSLSLWSAACATGEEPYTLGMISREASHLVGNRRVDIYATDISTRALELAAKASYAENKLREMSAAARVRFFDQSGDQWIVKDDIRNLVRFRRINLVDDRQTLGLPQMDIILCRNVFIYFSPKAKIQVARLLYAKLKPGGYLLLGNAETIDVVQVPFRMKFMEGGMVYWKPAGA